MAAKHCYRKGFLLLLFNFISTAALEKRFSDFKRCADEECSMLLVRGKAVRDFTGPDCRFLSFKKSETIYVYYKLSGRRTDMWAGSVGSNFGYFPKDLLAVNHLYTEKEVEIRAEETDFVCFDTGFDKFDNYDIDSLLVPSEERNEATSDQIQEANIATEETPPSEEAMSGEQQAEHYDNLDDLSASSHVPHDTLTESPVVNAVESEAAATLDGTAEEVHRDQGVEPVLEITSEESETKDTPTISLEESVPTENEPVSVSVGAQIPEVETTLGTTFDAVTTDDEITKNVTPHEEDDSKDEEYPPEEVHDPAIDTPLLSFSENTVDTPASASLQPTESPSTQEDKPKTEEGNVWTSIGDVMFSVVTGGERTTHDLSSEEDEDDEDQEEEPAAQTPLSFDAAKTNVQTPKPPENVEPTIQDPPQSSTKQDTKETNSGPDALIFEDEGEVVGHEQVVGELVEPPAEPKHHQKEGSVPVVKPLVQDDISGRAVVEQSYTQTSTEPTVNQIKDKTVEPDVKNNDLKAQDSGVVTQQDLHQTASQQALDMQKIREDQKKEPVVLDVNHKVNKADTSLPDQIHAHTPTDLKSNEDPEGIFFEEEEEPMDEVEEERNGVKEELLEDENALSYSQTDADEPPETVELLDEMLEPEYSDSVMRLTLLREHLTEESLIRVQKHVGLKNLFRIEAMFSDLDTELRATRQSDSATIQEIENALEAVLETSENAILDHIENILDNQSPKQDFDDQSDRNVLDEETQILDDFQELAFSLRQKYSTNSDSTPVAGGETPDAVPDEEVLNTTVDIPHVVEENLNNTSETENIDNLTTTNHHEQPAELEKEQIIPEEVPSQPDISMEGDGGHFNKNKDDPLDFGTSDELQKVPQDTFENPLDVGFGVEVDQPTSGSMDSMEPVPEIAQEEEEEAGFFLTGMVYSGCILSMMRNKTEEWTTVMISLLPEEWKPGETLFGCPWSAVVITALVGVMTFTLFFWRTVLAVKKREYLVDEKKLTEQIQSLKKEKQSALDKMSELQKQTERLKESQKESNVTITGTRKKMQALETKVLEAETRNEEMIEEKRKYEKLLEQEQENTHRNETRIEKLEKSNEKLLLSRKKIQEALTKTSVLLDEAKIREDARNVQQKCQEKDFATLKEENKSFKAAIKTWEEKHKELNEQIKVYQKSQKELEDSVVLKDHNVEVLSDLLADLDACDSQKSDTKAIANGEVELDKKTIIKNRIKQMMDVSRVQTTLTVVEEERDRFMTKLLGEEKTRKTLEEQHQELEHAIATLKSEKSHVENQFKILQQKNEIMVEMYQQKENALQQRLTKEELERRSKESLLSEVGGKAVEAEEQVKVLRQRINEMEEQMKKTEEVYKEQIKEQENKTHSNWVNARNAERALNQEKLESSKLREKLAVLTSQLNERRAPLFRPNSGQPAGPRQGDSYGPSPVSGGAPSPPLMIEGPRRPPSAPVGRRIDPYGPRPPSDPHGRYAENKHISGLDMMGPRSSSPANLDGSTQAVAPQIKADSQAEASTESPEPVGPGSFLASPIRDSPGPLVQGPPPGHGPHDPMLPGPHIRLPPPGPYRPPRPGPYHLPPGPPPPNVPPPLHGPPLPANGYPGMPPPGPMGGDFGPRPANGHAFPPRPGPGPVMDHRGPLPPHFRPPPPHHFGPMPPPPHDIRGPMGPRPPVPPDSRFPGQREHTGPLMDMPPGVPPHPSLQNSAGAHSGPGQDLRVKQEAPQDSARPAAVKP